MISIPFLIDTVFPKTILQNASNWCWLMGIAAISALIDLCRPDRVNELTIDPFKREIKLQYYNFNDGQTEVFYPFESLRVKIKSPWTIWLSRSTYIYFLKGNSDLVEISQNKDGFSRETIQEIKMKLEEITNPIGQKDGG